jgi:hypothetical protein
MRHLQVEGKVPTIQMLEDAIKAVNESVPARLINTVCSDSGSFAAQAFHRFHSARAMDCIIAAGWPVQIAGMSSLLGMSIAGRFTGRVSGAELPRILQPMLQRPELVDLRAIAPKNQMSQRQFDNLNCVQLALLLGDTNLVNSILAASTQIVDRDFQLLASSGGHVNMFHTAIESGMPVLPIFKLLFARQKSLGFYSSLCYEEWGDLRLTVHDALLVKHLHEPLLFLLEKGVDFESPLPRPHGRSLPSVLHAAFYEIATYDLVDFFKATERILVERRDIITKEILDMPYRVHGRPERSLLAAIVRAGNHSILIKALHTASETQKIIALKELSSERTFYEAPEKLLINAGANPLAEKDEHGDVPLHQAARSLNTRRILLMISVKGSTIATKVDQNGAFPVTILADSMQRYRGYFHDTAHVIPALKALFEPAVVKKSKSTLDHLQKTLTWCEDYTGSGSSEMRELAVAAAKFKEEVKRLHKYADR